MGIRRLFRIAGVIVLPVIIAWPARAAYFSPRFDPQFDGTALFQIGDPCLALANATYPTFGSCQIDLVSASLTDLTIPLSPAYSSGFQSNVGTVVEITSHEVSQFSSVAMALSCGIGCTGELQFSIGSTPSATLISSSGQTLSDGYRLVRVPEPGTAALLAGAVAAAAVARRRTTRAPTNSRSRRKSRTAGMHFIS